MVAQDRTHAIRSNYALQTTLGLQILFTLQHLAIMIEVLPWQGVQFYGGDYIQLTWAANYKAASKALLGNEMALYNDPDRVHICCSKISAEKIVCPLNLNLMGAFGLRKCINLLILRSLAVCLKRALSSLTACACKVSDILCCFLRLP